VGTVYYVVHGLNSLETRISAGRCTYWVRDYLHLYLKW